MKRYARRHPKLATREKCYTMPAKYCPHAIAAVIVFLILISIKWFLIGMWVGKEVD